MNKTDLAESRTILAELRDHALRRLPAMLLGQRGLFSYRTLLRREGLHNEGESLRYSAIAALGLLEASELGLGTEIDVGAVVEGLRSHFPQVGNHGDRGLILWTAARAGSGDLERLAQDEARELAAEAARPERTVDTMEYSWLLMGLLAAGRRGSSGLDGAIEAVYRDLTTNFHAPSGLFFYHRRQSARGTRFKALSFFAEQIYGVMALHSYYEHTGEREALERALNCARTLLALQTPRGGWPWRYHCRRGVVAEVYPLYSVHQDGMAPMALAPLVALGYEEFVPGITAGLRWLMGHNELRRPLYDRERDVIWRALQRRRPLGVVGQGNKLMSLVGLETRRVTDRVLPLFTFMRECRSYHLGWVLCAWARLERVSNRGGAAEGRNG